jgi:D-glycerate 3-kinase
LRTTGSIERAGPLRRPRHFRFAQGSGKTTLARALATAATAQGITTACLSLDDLYLTRAERLELSAKVHPLLATRGVPGTHDVSLGLRVIDALDQGNGRSAAFRQGTR